MTSAAHISPRQRGAFSGHLGDIARWMRAIPSKNGWGRLLLRGLLAPAIITVAGAVFTALGPVPLKPTLAGTPAPEDVHFILIGYLVFGQVVLISSGAWLHLRDVLSKELGMNYTAVPARTSIVTATSLFAGVCSLIFALVCTFLGGVSFALAAQVDLIALITTPALLQLAVGLSIGAGLLTMIFVAVAFLIRIPVLAMIVIVFWAAVGEDTISAIPGIGPIISTIGPMTNSFALAGVASGPGISASPLLCGIWLAVLAAACTALAALVETRRSGWIAG